MVVAVRNGPQKLPPGIYYFTKSLKEAVDKKFAEEYKEEAEDDDGIYNYGMQFKDEETTEKMVEELMPIFDIDDWFDNMVIIYNMKIKDEKFQEIADKFKIEFSVKYYSIDTSKELKEEYTKEFKPK